MLLAKQRWPKAQHPLNARSSGRFGLRAIEIMNVTFSGTAPADQGGFQLPKQRSGPLPCVVEYIGYRRRARLSSLLAEMAGGGYAHLV